MPTTRRTQTAAIFAGLVSPARYKGAYGGRGSGKSHFFAEMAVDRACDDGFRIVCVREVQKTLKESVKLLIEDKIRTLGVEDHFTVRHDHVIGPGKGLMIFQGMQDHTADSIKSLEGFDVAYVEEAQTLTERSLELLRPTIRKPNSELWFSWNPRSASDPVDKLLRGLNPPSDAAVIQVNHRDNPWFPKVLEDERQYDREHNRDRYGHIWEGDYEPVAIGAIWDRIMLHEGRRDAAPTLGRTVVGVDPAVSSEPLADEHGIIVAAQGEDGRGYVLEDGTTKGGPRDWATRAVAMFDKHEADAIVIEVNQGGDMCEHTLRTVRSGLPIIKVRASRGKHVRAEPIAALYATGRVSHVGAFPELEDQMCKMTAAGYEGEGSPDRCDALVWALTHLFPAINSKVAPPAERENTAVQRSGTGWMAA